jgi:hypothetical protein
VHAIRTALLLAAASLAALLVGPASASARQAGARLVSCHPALSPAQRSLTVEGQMSGASPGQRLEMRFDLYRRWRLGAGEVRVPGPGLGTVHRAHQGVRMYRFRQTVRNLSAPADYRMRVTLTWRSPQGAQVAQLTRFSALCHQPELRFDLPLFVG